MADKSPKFNSPPPIIYLIIDKISKINSVDKPNNLGHFMFGIYLNKEDANVKVSKLNQPFVIDVYEVVEYGLIKENERANS